MECPKGGCNDNLHLPLDTKIQTSVFLSLAKSKILQGNANPKNREEIISKQI